MAEAGDGKKRSNKRKRNNLLQKRVSDRELKTFIARSQTAGFSNHHEFLEALILGEHGVFRRRRRDLTRALGELGKQGSNLNQIARAINNGRVQKLSPEEMQTIENAYYAVSELAAAVRAVLKQ